MKPEPMLVGLLCAGLLAAAGSAVAQGEPPPPSPPSTFVMSPPKSDGRVGDGKAYRYPLPAVADTVRELQFAAQAVALREYCADKRIADEFVTARLAEFSLQTGREESCRTLLDY